MQKFPHAPQFAVLVARSTHQPTQNAKPDGQGLHFPPWQTVSPEHAFPQLPQLDESLPRSVHVDAHDGIHGASPQSTKPEGQAQYPLTHSSGQVQQPQSGNPTHLEWVQVCRESPQLQPETAAKANASSSQRIRQRL